MYYKELENIERELVEWRSNKKSRSEAIPLKIIKKIYQCSKRVNIIILQKDLPIHSSCWDRILKYFDKFEEEENSFNKNKITKVDADKLPDIIKIPSVKELFAFESSKKNEIQNINQRVSYKKIELTKKDNEQISSSFSLEGDEISDSLIVNFLERWLAASLPVDNG